MGVNEDHLRRIVGGGSWDIVKLDEFKQQMYELQQLMKTIADSPGWEGASADLARQNFMRVREEFNEIETKLADARKAIELANEAKTAAGNALNSLPKTGVPDWLVDAVDNATEATVEVPSIGWFSVNTALEKVGEFFNSQREAAAQEALNTLTQQLSTYRGDLQRARLDPGSEIEWVEEVQPPPEPIIWGGDDSGYGAWRSGGGGGYSGGGGGTGGGGGGGGGGNTGGGGGGDLPPRPNPPVGLPEEPPVGWPNRTIGVDGDISGGSSGLGGLGAGLSGGGLGSGLLGAGAGAGAIAAGSKLAGGGLGASGMFGNGAGGAAGGAGSNSTMMGGAPGGGGAGGGNKDKRSSMGLMAPKLEDDEESGPRSAAAGAGGRE